jgi:hypothetical protein
MRKTWHYVLVSHFLYVNIKFCAHILINCVALRITSEKNHCVKKLHTLFIFPHLQAEPNRLHFTKTKMDVCVLTNHMRLI